MCRHLCYLGPPVSLASMVLDPPHSLLVQSYAPNDMRGAGSVNADGFGVGWFVDPDEDGSTNQSDDAGAPPAGSTVQYRRSGPIWQDAGFAQLAAATRSTGFLASVRNATAGMIVAESAAAPFVGDGWVFSLNGRIDGWPGSAVKLAEGLSTEELLTLDAPTDAALLWAVIRRRLGAGQDPGDVLRDVVAETLATAPESRLNLLLTDGRTAWATAVTHSLSVRLGPAIIASEPLDDDPAWRAVPEHSLVRMDWDNLSVEPLDR